MILSASQIAQVAAAAGWSGNDLATAVAIALAESSGNTQAYNPETQAGAPAGKGSIGLWQIFLTAHPEYAGEDLTDPQVNANAAYSVYAVAGGFTPWSTYTSGRYQRYLPGVLAVIGPPADQPPVTFDAATGLPIADSKPTPPRPGPGNVVASMPTFMPAVPQPAPSFGTVLLWTILGIGALWVLSETA